MVKLGMTLWLVDQVEISLMEVMVSITAILMTVRLLLRPASMTTLALS